MNYYRRLPVVEDILRNPEMYIGNMKIRNGMSQGLTGAVLNP